MCSGNWRARAMTLTEMAVVVMAVGAGLFLLNGWMGSIREGAKRDLATRMLASLDKALARYHRETGEYPAAAGLEPARSAVTTLYRFERTGPLLADLPPSVLRGDAAKGFWLVDPWGRRLRYVTQDNAMPYARANEGRPVFVSAGPDRRFGVEDPAGIGDDLRSDDPGPEGFRPRFLTPDP